MPTDPDVLAMVLGHPTAAPFDDEHLRRGEGMSTDDARGDERDNSWSDEGRRI